MRTGAARLAVGTLVRAARDRHVLAARRGLLRLRRDDDGAGPAALHAGGARPRHAGDDGGDAARARRRVRPRRHDRVGLADRPVRPADPARGVLRAARGVAGAAGAAVRRGPQRQRARVRDLLRTGLGGHRAADAGADPGGVRGRGADRVRLDLRVAPARCGVRGAGRRIARDALGSYDAAWYGGAVLCAVGAALSLSIRRRPARSRPLRRPRQPPEAPDLSRR